GIRDATVTGVQTCALPISFLCIRVHRPTLGLIEASERNARPETARESQLNERGHMRRTVIILSCAMVAPLAFAQTQTTKTRQTTTTQPAITRATTQMTTGAVTVGTVTAFTPGQITTTAPSPIVVQSSPDAQPISYVPGRKAT